MGSLSTTGGAEKNEEESAVGWYRKETDDIISLISFNKGKEGAELRKLMEEAKGDALKFIHVVEKMEQMWT